MSRKESRATVGAKLKKARERRGLSLQQIAESTKISRGVLQGLERDEIRYLPGGVLGRGYVRSFAKAVKLDPEITVAEFVAQFPESSVKDGYPPSEKNDADKGADVRAIGHARKIRLNDSGNLGRVAASVALAVVLAGVMAFAAPKGWTALHSWVTAPVSVAPPLLNAHPIQLARAFEPPALPRARALAAAAGPEANAGAVATSSPISAKNAAPTPTPAAPATDATRETSGESTRVSSDSPSAVIKAEAPQSGTLADQPLRVVLSVSTPSWVIASVDGTAAVDRLFEVGDEQTLEVKDELVLTAGNRVAILMTLNGAPAKPLGKTPSPLKVRITRANFKTYLGTGDSPKPADPAKSSDSPKSP